MVKEKPKPLWQCLQTNTCSHLLLCCKWRQVFHGTSLFKLLSWAILYFQSTQRCRCFIIWLSCIFLQGSCCYCCLGCFVYGGFDLVLKFWWGSGLWVGVFLGQGSRSISISVSMFMCFYAKGPSGTWKPTQCCNIQVEPLKNWFFFYSVRIYFDGWQIVEPQKRTIQS